MMQILDKKYLEEGMSYEAYRQLIHELLQKGKTTGPDSSEIMVHYTQLNEKRMQRLDKTIKLIPELKDRMIKWKRKSFWIILTEGWCGDAAQNVPAIEKMAKLSTQITTFYLLRDEHLNLMDQYLTRGGKAIPKLISYDAQTLEPFFSWGPRPAPAQEMFWKMHDEGISHSDIVVDIQNWYNSDQSLTLQREFLQLMEA